ncbi:MAG TPA: glutamate--tRNA ligase, partial [Blastocatellia bacterium]|nr:glutamate--tRNA ligase [Blastocatellia bacterium]
GGDQEIMSREDLIEKFSLDAVNKSSAVFNFSEGNSHDWTDPKALWMNGEYIKSMPLDQLLPLVAAHLKKAGLWRSEYESDGRQWFARTVDLLRARYRTLSDFASLGRPYFSDDFEMDPAAVKKNLAKDGLRTLLTGFCDRVAHLEDFTHDSIEAVLREYAEENGVKAGLLINAARTALTGQAVGPGMFDIFVTVGREKTVARLRAAVELAA